MHPNGRWLNVGQTCVAPDYVLVHESLTEEFVSKMRATITKWYGEGDEVQQKRIGNAHLINSGHAQRVRRMIENTSGTVVLGGIEGSDTSPGKLMDFILKMINVFLKMMEFVVILMDLMLTIMDIIVLISF